MASRRVEDAHVTDLDNLLSESGVKCKRTVIETPEEVVEEEVEEEAVSEEVAEEEHATKDEAISEEDKHEILLQKEKKRRKNIFPSPSLRNVLPDHVREIEAENRIHVLPKECITDIDPALIPHIATTPAHKYIDVIAELLGCTGYKSSMAEYWFLDTTANLLRRAQEDGLDKTTQAILIIWFCEWIKEMQHFDAADRERMMRRFKDNMLAAASVVAMDERLPTPKRAGITHKRETHPHKKSPSLHSVYSEKLPRDLRVSFRRDEKPYECSLHDLVKIIHYIFDLFSTDYQYELVRSVFTFTPEYIPIDVPHKLQTPKSLYPPPPRRTSKSPKKKDSILDKLKKEEMLPSAHKDYNALMALKLREYVEITEREDKEKEEWKRKSHILPLNFAMDPSLMEKYWPKSPEPSLHSMKTGRKKKEKI